MGPVRYESSDWATWHSSMRLDVWDALWRYAQIQRSATRHGLTRWLAIDDNVDGWPAQLSDRLVACDGDRGVSDPATQDDLRRKLALL